MYDPLVVEVVHYKSVRCIMYSLFNVICSRCTPNASKSFKEDSSSSRVFVVLSTCDSHLGLATTSGGWITTVLSPLSSINY